MMKLFAMLAVCFLAAGISPGAVAGDVEDCKNYFDAKDYKRAFPVCSRAAKQGDADAQFRLGWMYDTGEGVTENDREAVKWFRLVAEQGDAIAQFNLGQIYRKGEGVTKNDREAVKWFRLAAEQGDAVAQLNLGLMYGKGAGVTKNHREAVKWFRLAAEQGYANAQAILGVVYAKGEGVIQDYQEAYIWFSLAVANGVGYASEGRDTTATLLTDSELQIAQQEAKKRMQQIESRIYNNEN